MHGLSESGQAMLWDVFGPPKFTIRTASHRGAKREFPGSALESAPEGASGALSRAPRSPGAPSRALSRALAGNSRLAPLRLAVLIVTLSEVTKRSAVAITAYVVYGARLDSLNM